MAKTAAGYQYLSVNAYNPWAMIGSDGNAAAGLRRRLVARHGAACWGPIPGFLIGTVSAGASASRWAWRASRGATTGAASCIVAILLALGFFILPTRVHERYMFPIFAFLPLLAVVNRRWAGGDDRAVDRRPSSTCTAS